MSDISVIKLVIIIILGISFFVVDIVSYNKGYRDCLNDLDEWLTDLMEGRK